ncbi:hypothetical protein [Chroococcidiopsis sp.]
MNVRLYQYPTTETVVSGKGAGSREQGVGGRELREQRERPMTNDK